MFRKPTKRPPQYEKNNIRWASSMQSFLKIFYTLDLYQNKKAAPKCAHLHWIDGRLSCSAGQRPGHEPLVGLHLPRFTGQHLFVLKWHSERRAVRQNSFAHCFAFTQPTVWAASQRSEHLLVGHELDGRLGGDLQDVDAVPSPQGGGAALLQHLLKAADQADLVALGRVHLNREQEVFRI